MIAEVAGTLLSHTDSATSPGTTYYYDVSAVNGGGTEGSRSNEANALALDPAILGFWKLDDGTGTIAQDSSVNGNDGTLTNGPTWSTGQLNGA